MSQRNLFVCAFLILFPVTWLQAQSPEAQDSKEFQDVRSVIQEGMLSVDVMELTASPRFAELSAKLAAGLRKNHDWAMKQIRDASGALPYDERLGMTKEEYEEYLATPKKFDIAKQATTEIGIKGKSPNVFVLDGGSELPNLTGIEIDFENDTVVTEYGTLQGGRELHAKADSALGACDGWAWRFEKMETENSGTSIMFDIAKMQPSGRYSMYYEVKRLSLAPLNFYHILTFDHPDKRPLRPLETAASATRPETTNRRNHDPYAGRTVTMEIPGVGLEGATSFLSQQIGGCADEFGNRKFSQQNGMYRGKLAVVNDFDRFCERIEALGFITISKRDAERMWLSLDVDWSIVKKQLPQRSEPERHAPPMAGLPIERMSPGRGLPSPDSPEYFPELVSRLNNGDHFEQLAAGKALLEVDADKLPSKEILKGAAKGFLALAKQPIPDAKELGIEGMVHFGGKHSVSRLIEILNETRLEASPLIYETLAQYPSAESARAVGNRLGILFDNDLPERTLIKMKQYAEPVAVDALQTNDRRRALAAIAVLDKVGTAKSKSVLTKAKDAGDPEVALAAANALLRIGKRSAESKPQ